MPQDDAQHTLPLVSLDTPDDRIRYAFIGRYQRDR